MNQAPRRAVFLDRDGVINEAILRDGKPYPPASLDALRVLPGVPEALSTLREAGFLLLVVTNQPDVARKLQTRETVEQMHALLRQALLLDDFFVCWHDDADSCCCRKPAPGLLLTAASKYGLDLASSFMVGDRWRDVEAGRRAGCKTVWLDMGYLEQEPALHPDLRVSSLGEATEWILKEAERTSADMKLLQDLRVRIYADGAEKAGMLEMYSNPLISGFTTNPTLMRKAGIANYEIFAREILSLIPDRPISLEVFADEFDEMERQARVIARWGNNVYVKIPVTNTRGESSAKLARRLSKAGIQINVTALTTLRQVEEVADALRGGAPSNISIFAGRIADTGVDPVPLMASAIAMVRENPEIELIWASPRELLNIFHADAVGCHIITVTNDILKKLPLIGKNLTEYSLDTVKMFYADACASKFTV